jgi:CubicO group peptidase (beta-lactamase class C family)
MNTRLLRSAAPHRFRLSASLSLLLPALTLLLPSSGLRAAGPDPSLGLGLPEASPAAEGFSPARIARIPALLQREVDAQHYAGAVWLVARQGWVVSHGAVGWRDAPAHAAMTEDSEFRIYSMTKIITTVTALSLWEEGRFNLDDPVERYLPQLARRQVLVGGTADAPVLEPAAGSITMRQLLTQTSGLPYDLFAKGTLREIWLRPNLWQSRSLSEFVTKVSTLPLAHQPGARWTYGVNTDLLGAVIQVVAGRDLETVMRERVLTPLGMDHTSFRPDAATLARLAAIHHRTPDGRITTDQAGRQGVALQFPSGGGGLFSNLHDYARFAQMLLNGGELNGTRILGRKTVELMTTNAIVQLPPPVSPTSPWAFGFGVRIRTDADPRLRTLGSPGEFGWEGLATTYVSMDPKEQVLLLLLIQHAPQNEDSIVERFSTSAYQALN